MKCTGEKQFERLFKKHVDDVYKVAVYYTGNVDDAKTVTEKAFLKLHNNFNTVNPEYALGYLIHEVKNLILEKSDKILLEEEATDE